jgi:hypothetical protein
MNIRMDDKLMARIELAWREIPGVLPEVLDDVGPGGWSRGACVRALLRRALDRVELIYTDTDTEIDYV